MFRSSLSGAPLMTERDGKAMSSVEIQKHVQGIAELEAQLASAQTERDKLVARRREVRNWLAGHRQMSADQLETIGVKQQFSSYQVEDEDLARSLEQAGQVLTRMESELLERRSASFPAALVLEDKKGRYTSLRDELAKLFQKDGDLIARRDEACKESARTQGALRAAKERKARAMSVDEMTVSDQAFSEAGRRHDMVQELLRNLDTMLVDNGSAKSQVRDRLRMAECELWRAQSAAVIESIRGKPWFEEYQEMMTDAFASALMSGDAFDLGRFLAVVFTGRVEDPRVAPKIVSGRQSEMATDLGIEIKDVP
ncbi:MAG: hypothetical protein PHI64_19440 [Zoogloea sp.]|uniref:hypothetical protein n=1 Tax=Zoogloea sp. TaxID=49181 RepID=UPI00260705B2|nr:hypothetical protein [Zoogloea sp.]MDD2991114.1 hypothetical protein [Zoogloea sp.]